MHILYHLTAPEPAIPGTDAALQDVEALRARFGGEVLPLYPLRAPSRWFPRALYGLQRLPALRRLERAGDFTGRLALQEAAKSRPAGLVWDEFCRRRDVPPDAGWMGAVQAYERRVLAARSSR